MNSRLRRIVAGLVVAACSFGLAATGSAQAPKVLKISHQFPAATGDEGEFRDLLA